MNMQTLKFATRTLFSRGTDFALGWNEGVRRYRDHQHADIIGPSGFNPKEMPESYAASEAAVAYCIALKRTR